MGKDSAITPNQRLLDLIRKPAAAAAGPVRAVAAKRARSLAGLEPHVARRRLAGVLARRGFPSDVVTRVLGEVLGSDVD